jgi:thymidylate synthase ThyX
MTTITAKIIADSVSELTGDRLTTFELVYPRCIHAELMTHRVFSRNASSSRAIPVSRQIQMIEDDPFVPIYWGKNQKGMQASEECNEPVNVEESSALTSHNREDAWRKACAEAVKFAKAFSEAGYHKQVVNRLLEPFAHIKVVVTATRWQNFFELRTHKDAEPHFQHLAKLMLEEYRKSVPVTLAEGQWHTPYVTKEEAHELVENFGYLAPIKVSAARCARTSYLNFDGTVAPFEKDIELHDKLVSSQPLHASPCEHQAYPSFDSACWGNFRGFAQYRKEYCEDYTSDVYFEGGYWNYGGKVFNTREEADARS